MARVLIGGEWYQGLSSTALLEREFETLVSERAEEIFPGWRVVPFKMDVVSDDDVRRPDLALVDPLYRDWWVVEIELAHHPFKGHVYPQVLAFSRGMYGVEHAEYLAQKDPTLDSGSLHTMMMGKPPGVHVLVNDYVDGWMPALDHLEVTVGIAEVFLSEQNQVAVRLNGSIPRMPSQMSSNCRRARLLPRAWEVDTPAILPATDDGALDVLIDDQVSEWQKLMTGDRIYIVPRKGDPTGGADSATLSLGADSVLIMQIAPDGR